MRRGGRSTSPPRACPTRTLRCAHRSRGRRLAWETARSIEHDSIRLRLTEARGRRDAEDLPADRPRPADAATARAVARELGLEIETHYDQERQAEQERIRLEGRATELHLASTKCSGLRDTLRSAADASGVELPVATPLELPAADDALASAVDARRTRFNAACHRAKSTRDKSADVAESVRRAAGHSQFADLRAQYQERMKVPTDALCEDAARLAGELATRSIVVQDALARLDDDRRLIVSELLHVADGVTTLLRRAERASQLPATLEGWGGKPYLRIGFSFPEADAERRARLEPLVDRLVALAEIPDGIALVVRTASELAGAKGFDVKILKPDTVLRPDPIPLPLMSTFSRGQQLTAAILLYCTLVQLRARSRGRGHSVQDAGILILDNPIGTCSNVRLLQLQREIAALMRVQLIYTTGVEDLEALATFPNKIRLRNTHRDRPSGDFHVTVEEPDHGAVDGVRLVEVPPR